MPQKVNPNKSDLSVSVGATLRKRFAAACLADEISLSQGVKEAIKRWLATRERAAQRAKSKSDTQ
jgi:hypothetical protein